MQKEKVRDVQEEQARLGGAAYEHAAQERPMEKLANELAQGKRDNAFLRKREEQRQRDYAQERKERVKRRGRRRRPKTGPRRDAPPTEVQSTK